MPNSCDSKPFQARMVPSLTPCFSVCFVSCSTPRVKVCSPEIPLVRSVGTVELDVCELFNSHLNRMISAACIETEPSENQLLLWVFPSALSPAGTSHCNSCMFKPKACVLMGGMEFMWNVLNSSSFGKMQFFLGLYLQRVHWCSAGCQDSQAALVLQKELLLIIQQWQKWNCCWCGWLVKSGETEDPFWGYRGEGEVVAVAVRCKAAGGCGGSSGTAMLGRLLVFPEATAPSRCSQG